MSGRKHVQAGGRLKRGKGFGHGRGGGPAGTLDAVRGVNPEVPADWAADRTRPLCPYPTVARYRGRGDVEQAGNWSCRRSGGSHHDRRDNHHGD